MSKVIELGNKLKSISKIQNLTEAMQVVAVAQLKKVQERQRLAVRFREHYDRLAAKVGLDLKPGAAKVKPVVWVYVFAAERGFCGSFNQSLLLAVENFVHDKEVQLVVLGRKGNEVFKDATFSLASPAALAEEAAELFQQGEAQAVYLCYNQFKSMLVQQPIVQKVLPFEAKAAQANDFVLLEPSLAKVREFVTINYLKAIFYDAFMQSQLGEVASRLMTMRSASENAQEIMGDLRIKFNKARQAMITVELSEIVSSFEILNEGV